MHIISKFISFKTLKKNHNRKFSEPTISAVREDLAILPSAAVGSYAATVRGTS